MKKKAEKTQFFSEGTGKFYQLLPTRTVPALRINAVPMHRFAKIDPKEHTARIIEAAKPHGKVLDICTGLGYSAIACAKKNEVRKVVTIEIDEQVIAIAKMNQASKALFENKKIAQIIGDAALEISNFADFEFDCIISDPPTFTMATELYTPKFYSELFRVLKKSGTLWHYAAEPGKAGVKKDPKKLGLNIAKKLEEAGFIGVQIDGKSTGVVARKN
ncbi:MAG TPA: methyltransferase [archaeon]|nr:methyltransferase [archaeon]